MGTTKKYWKGLEELHNDPEFAKVQQNEFTEYVPVEKFLENDSLKDTTTNRRDFLKFLGFSVTAASLAACEAPVTKAIPYVIKPEEITPGVANWYASTYFDENDYCSVLVKTREGRPIKIEGNSLSPITHGGANARVHASVLSLYDTERLAGPYAKGAPAAWGTVDSEVGNKLAAIVAKGGNIRILSSSIISPSTKQVIADFIAKYPGTKHISYDAVSYAAIIKANQSSFGKAVVPTYSFDKANVIVSLGADFLANWISPIEFTKQYVKTRKVSKQKKTMSRHYQFESILSLTGSNADKRIPLKPSQIGSTAVNLYNAVARLAGGSPVNASALPFDKEIEKVAKQLAENKGKSLVVCGANDVAIQLFVNAINNLLGNYGSTIDIENPTYFKQGDDEKFATLVTEMKDGKVDALITYKTNPVYTCPASLGFEAAYKKVGLKISFSDRQDETAKLADYICPDHHYLESWNDANPRKGHYSLAQPAITPVFAKPRFEGTRSAQESLLIWTGNFTDYHSYIQKYWQDNLFPKQGKYITFTEFWNTSLHNGVVELNAGATAEAKGEVSAVTGMNLNEAATLIGQNSKGGNWELVLYEKTGIGSGNQANNPWLQELPDPISKVTWDNYITMNPEDMKGKYNTLDRYNQLEMKADMAKVSANGVTVELPVFPQPGQARGTIGIAVGYGRNGAGKCADNVGQNVYPFALVANGTLQYMLTNVEVSEKTGNEFQLACTQTHHTLMGRNMVKETDLGTYLSDPKEEWNKVEQIHTHKGKLPPEKVDLWDEHIKPNHLWGMSIDLNSCIGCGACVVSCNAENNVSVVGKEEVRRSREMHWMRIDRYYTSDMTHEKAEQEGKGTVDMYLEMEVPTSENPQVVFQPMLCQHCNHAPCETVCPVLATNHSSEGLNQMTYNRCVGTRYCANNCPYKVRRFNWFQYDTNDRFADVNPSANDLGRMVLNPDVVVRSRGVMEKCSLCVQRIQEGKLTAKKELRKVKDGDIQTACSSSCPADAITFGDLNDTNSMVTQMAIDDRAYHVLAEVGTRPNISYLTKVRNLAPEDVVKKEQKQNNGGEHH